MTVQLVCREHTLLTSSATADEIRRVVKKPNLLRFLDETAFKWIEQILHASETVSITRTVQACRDPLDDKFLELAVNGNADIIISGDNDLLSMNNFDGIPIVTPAIFMKAFYR